MLLSMTGFGKASGTFESKKITIEVRSLNSKSADINVRMPSIYRELEHAIRKNLTNQLERGKIDLTISIDSADNSRNAVINKELVKAYFEDLKSINDSIGQESTNYLDLILKMPDIYLNEKEVLTEQECDYLLQLVDESCVSLVQFRRQEGIALENEFNERIGCISDLLKEVPKYEEVRIDAIRERMKKALEEATNVKFDENRLEQELIFCIEKLDVAEEKMRLSNHLTYFLETMQTEASGKKLGFITQELGREINTLGSKSNHAEMQKLVVDMKDNLEKIKEQVLNTL
jgi:uncharacterized protein (TIGR00255 family)